MRFRMGSHLLVADVEHEESFASPRTGGSLRRLVIVFEVDDDAANSQYLDLLDASLNNESPKEHGLTSETPEGDLSGVWNILDASFGPIHGQWGTAWRHRWELEEREAPEPPEGFIPALLE